MNGLKKLLRSISSTRQPDLPADACSDLTGRSGRSGLCGSWPVALIVPALWMAIPGCGRDDASGTAVEAVEKSESTAAVPAVVSTADSSAADSSAADAAAVGQPRAYEFTAQDLLAARLPSDEASAGWIRLFDGQTLFGWEIAGDANWRVEEGTIVADGGEACLLCTSVPWQDYELTLEFRAGEKTNSGVFLRTPLAPADPATDCYEVNIAADDHPFPTASVVGRQRTEPPEPGQKFDNWRTLHARLIGDQLEISIDGALVCEYTDPLPLPAGRIGLQHNSGPVAFRNIRLRPLGMEDLLDAELTRWTRYPEMPGEFSTTDEGWLHVRGGRTQLESKDAYDDFVLLADYKLPAEEMNSGIFFRCIPGDEMMGYECQISNQSIDGNRLTPADHGTGGFFRRQPARVVAGETGAWTSVLLVASGAKMAAWVDGIQVSDWQDDREPNENPRKGRRLQPGTLMIQGHDPETEAWFKQIKVTTISRPAIAEAEPTE